MQSMDKRIDGRFKGLEGKIKGLDGKITGLDGKITGLEGKMQGLEGKISQVISTVHHTQALMEESSVAKTKLYWTELRCCSNARTASRMTWRAYAKRSTNYRFLHVLKLKEPRT